MKRNDFTHFYELSVRWGDADLLGHINNTEFLRYLESGRIDYCDHVLNLIYNKELSEAFILADVQCSFLQQIHYPSRLQIATRVSKIGNSSAELAAAIFCGDNEEPAATSISIVVWFDFSVQESRRIPDAIRENILKFENIPPE